MLDDTIAAVATPLGEGGLAVVRISGPRALAVADQCFRPAGKSGPPSHAATHTLHYGHVTHSGRAVDEALLAVMRAPRTYTREDIVEISCHGGLLPAKAVLDAVLACGARLALPGEFTQRAFLNGRIDLAQAEAVADLIHARTDLALRAAGEQLAGKLSRRINQLRDDLMAVLAHVEAHIDFPDEDIEPDTFTRLLARLEQGQAFVRELLGTAQEGRILRRGIRAAIVGRPNAGKSSLLNQLLGHDRAIVSATPGTTRDTIEETANIRGIPVVFIDTAGLREAEEEVELEGVRRSRQALEQAELILHVVDGAKVLTPADEASLADSAGRTRLIIVNKCDLPPKAALPPPVNDRVVHVSCRTGEGIEALKDAVKQQVWSGGIGSEMLEVMINARHQDALNRAARSLELTLAALRAGETLDLVAVDLHAAVNAVGEVVGKTTTEDLLDSIFSQFCIGK
jgi:tRNA modification GTPase